MWIGLQTSKHLQREVDDDDDEEMGLGGPGALEIDDPSQPGHERHATAASKKHHKEDAAAAAKLMREWSDVQLKVSSCAQTCQPDLQASLATTSAFHHQQPLPTGDRGRHVTNTATHTPLCIGDQMFEDT